MLHHVEIVAEGVCKVGHLLNARVSVTNGIDKIFLITIVVVLQMVNVGVDFL